MKVLQISPWSNCNNHCVFCYERGDEPFSLEDRRKHLQDTYDMFVSSEVFKKFEFDGFGLIGGEFFGGQLVGLEDIWFKLIHLLANLLKEGKLEQVWINSNLIDSDMDLLKRTFDVFDWDVLTENQKILLPTSYDAKGRFHTEEAKQKWYDTVKKVSEMYPKLGIYGTAVTTQAFIEEMLEDRFVYPEGMRALHLLVPRLVDKDYLNEDTHTGKYREALMSKLHEYPEWFFPKSRQQFIEFMYKVKKVLGEEVIRNFYDVTKHSSDAYTYFPYKNKYFVNRHTIENRHENMECGHPYTSCCYLDSDKCSHCDCERIIKFGNKE